MRPSREELLRGMSGAAFAAADALITVATGGQEKDGRRREFVCRMAAAAAMRGREFDRLAVVSVGLVVEGRGLVEPGPAPGLDEFPDLTPRPALVFLVEFVGGRLDGSSRWLPACCPGCGGSVLAHLVALSTGEAYGLEQGPVPGKLVARLVVESGPSGC